MVFVSLSSHKFWIWRTYPTKNHSPWQSFITENQYSLSYISSTLINYYFSYDHDHDHDHSLLLHFPPLSLSPLPLTTPMTILPPTPHPPLLQSNKSVKPLASLTNAWAPYPKLPPNPTPLQWRWKSPMAVVGLKLGFRRTWRRT